MKDPNYIADQYKWARTSAEAKAVNDLEKEFLEKVVLFKKQALYGKQEAKRKKQERVLKLLDQCKAHGGPVTKTSIDLLDELTLEDLRIEALYLKNTLAPQLKIKKRSDVDPISKRYRMIDFTPETLRKTIQEVICPNLDLNNSKDIDTLIQNVCFK